MGFSIKVQGLDTVLKNLSQYPVKLQDQVRGEIKLAAEEVKRGAVRDAPGDTGRLRQSITVNQETGLSNTVTVGVGYGAYQEWGTKSKTRVPAELQAYAARFKGSGQSNVSMKQAIDEWVRRKGIGAQLTKSGKASKSASSIAQQKHVAFLIRRKILKEGIRPHPYFFKNVFFVRDKLVRRIKEIVTRL